MGDIKGTTTLVQVSQSLSELADKEKPRTSAMFDREYTQENILGKVGAGARPGDMQPRFPKIFLGLVATGRVPSPESRVSSL